MNLLKKCAALLLTGAITFSCAACSGEDTDWIMQNGELEMPAGVYINSMIESYYEASALVEDKEKDVLKQQIDRKDASQWIQEEALKTTKENMAICAKFNELGLSFTEQELMTCQTQAESYYEQAGKNLEKNGISKDSIELLYQITYMKVKVFDAIYGEGGTQEIPESELRDYYEKNYIKMAVETFNFPAEPEIPENVTEDQKALYDEFYQNERSNVYTNANNLYTQGQIGREQGKDWNEVLNLYHQESASEGEEYDVTTNNYRLVDTATTTLNADIIGALKDAEIGEIVKVETDKMVAVGATADLNEDPTDFAYVESMIRHALKDEEFENMMLEEAAGESFVVNQKAVDRYTPNKLDMGQ